MQAGPIMVLISLRVMCKLKIEKKLKNYTQKCSTIFRVSIPKPVEMETIHWHTTWTIAVECCTREGRNLFPCKQIVNGYPEPDNCKKENNCLNATQIEVNRKSEQAFSTACKYLRS